MEKRRLKRDGTIVFRYWKECNMEDMAELFLDVPRNYGKEDDFH